VNLNAYGEITSVVVSRGGEVVAEEYAEGDAETLRNTRSCTKTVAGMLLGIAIARGIVPGVDTSLAELLGEPAPPVTLRDLLTMSSFLECNDWDDASPGNEELMYPRQDWLAFALGLPMRETRTFSYCTAGVVALGIGLERALGEPLPVFAQRELFEPLGIERAEWQLTPLGQTSTAGERSFFMSGMGGNRVHAFPERDLVAVITTTNFRRRDAHALSDRLVVEQILGA
jgi:CubicO group peptidase (beta-lactamase class C family)